MLKKLTTSHLLSCDVEGCHQDVLGQSADACMDDAALIGWRLGTDAAKGPHTCPECAAGHLPTAAIVASLDDMGGVTVSAHADVQTGDAVLDVGGQVLAPGATMGTAKHPAKAGTLVAIQASDETVAAITGFPVAPGRDGTPRVSPMAMANATRGDSLPGITSTPENEQAFTDKRTAEHRQADAKAADATARLGFTIEAADPAMVFGDWDDDPDV